MSRYLLPVTAAVAFLWAVARAALQSITIDEADSYLHFADRVSGAYWFPAANNHILNSALMRLTATIFGLSHFTVRLPALLGAALLLYAAYRLCRLLSDSWFVQWVLFVCLVFNPFVGDFLVAARGYGMALGFLLLAVVQLAPSADPLTARRIAAASALSALALTANFSFALIAAATLCAIVYAAHRAHTIPRLHLFAAATLPAAAILFLGPLWTLRRFPRAELWWGAASLPESLTSLSGATLYQLNPELANTLMLAAFRFLQPLLLPAVALTALAWAVYLWIHRTDRTALWSERRPRFAATLALIVAAAFAIHAAAHTFLGLMLPKERTGLYAPVLLILAAGALAAVPPFSRLARVLRGALLTSLVALAAYFLFCLRLDHFKEWPWDAETKQLYGTLACLNHEHGVRQVTSVWLYESPLNFYRIASGKENLEPVVGPDADRPGTQVYVINSLFDAQLVGQKNLQLLSSTRTTNAWIAVKPALYDELRTGPCLH